MSMFARTRWIAAKVLALVVVGVGIVVLAGWILDVGVLKSISAAWVSMKFDTAIAFVMSGITLFFMVRVAEGEFDLAQVVLSVTSLMIFLLMGTLLFSSLLGIRTGAEDLFVKDLSTNGRTVVPGRPSIPTMVSFLLIAGAAVLAILNPERMRPRVRAIGLVVGVIGALAAAGYVLDAPRLYYFIPGVNTGMACLTAVSFVLIGTGFLCL
jgi:hypothetical protein